MFHKIVVSLPKYSNLKEMAMEKDSEQVEERQLLVENKVEYNSFIDDND